MSENELGDALLRFDAAQLAGVPDVRQLTQRVLERDRRRVRRLTAVTVAVWILAGALVLTGLVLYGLVFPRQALLMQQADAGALTPAEREAVQREVLVAFLKATLLVACAVAMMPAAALCTVILILSSRRATLRHINASLAALSEQLKRMAPPAPGG